MDKPFWLVLCLLVMHSGCTYSRAQVQYDEFQQQVAIQADTFAGAKSLGTVRADSKGAVWDDCETLVQSSILTLADKARALGGNALGEVRWIPDDRRSYKKPRCKRRWGLFLFPPLLMSPIFMSATVEATAYRIE